VIVVVLEALQSIYQFQNNWISYRSTAEALKHEKYLWYAGAGHYLNAENPEALLAERIEALISTENAKWISDKEQAGKARPTTVQQ
jgi:Trk K+ transport system NAD-binding subunit